MTGALYFATLDLLAGGRAEIMAGRGSFIESFSLFGYDLDDYNALFDEKLDLLLKLRAAERLTWTGAHRAALQAQGVYPRPLQQPLPVWVAVGGTPESVVRAATRGLPMALAIIGGSPAQFVPLVGLYREAAARAGHDPAQVPVGINAHAYLADSAGQARDEFYPAYATMMNRIGRERGWSGMTRAQFEVAKAPQALHKFLLGSLEQTSGPQPAVFGWYADWIHAVALPNELWYSTLVAYGELFVGLALLLGVFTKWMVFAGLGVSYYGLDAFLLPALGRLLTRGRGPRPTVAARARPS